MDLITGVMMASIAVLLGYIFTGINVFTVVLAPLVLWMLYFAQKSSQVISEEELEY